MVCAVPKSTRRSGYLPGRCRSPGFRPAPAGTRGPVEPGCGNGYNCREPMRGPRVLRTTESPASCTMNFDELLDTAEYAPPPPGAATQAPRSSTSVQIDLAGRSHQGKVRPNNEDHFLIVRFGRFLETLLSN